MKPAAILTSLVFAWTAWAGAMPKAELAQDSDPVGGIGAVITTNGHHIVVKHVLSETPAQRAGLLAGDIIQSVDGRNVQGLTLSEAVMALRGTPGSTAKLVLLRQGQSNSIPISVVRETMRAVLRTYHRPLFVTLPDQGKLTLSLPHGWTGDARTTELYAYDGSASSNHWNVTIQGTNNTRLSMLPTRMTVGPEDVETRVREWYEILGGTTSGLTFAMHTNVGFHCCYYFGPTTAEHWTGCDREAHGVAYLDRLIVTFTGFFLETNEWKAAIHILENAHFESKAGP